MGFLLVSFVTCCKDCQENPESVRVHMDGAVIITGAIYLNIITDRNFNPLDLDSVCVVDGTVD